MLAEDADAHSSAAREEGNTSAVSYEYRHTVIYAESGEAIAAEAVAAEEAEAAVASAKAENDETKSQRVVERERPARKIEAGAGAPAAGSPPPAAAAAAAPPPAAAPSAADSGAIDAVPNAGDGARAGIAENTAPEGAGVERDAPSKDHRGPGVERAVAVDAVHDGKRAGDGGDGKDNGGEREGAGKVCGGNVAGAEAVAKARSLSTLLERRKAAAAARAAAAATAAAAAAAEAEAEAEGAEDAEEPREEEKTPRELKERVEDPAAALQRRQSPSAVAARMAAVQAAAAKEKAEAEEGGKKGQRAEQRQPQGREEEEERTCAKPNNVSKENRTCDEGGVFPGGCSEAAAVSAADGEGEAPSARQHHREIAGDDRAAAVATAKPAGSAAGVLTGSAAVASSVAGAVRRERSTAATAVESVASASAVPAVPSVPSRGAPSPAVASETSDKLPSLEPSGPRAAAGAASAGGVSRDASVVAPPAAAAAATDAENEKEDDSGGGGWARPGVVVWARRRNGEIGVAYFHVSLDCRKIICYPQRSPR